MSFALNVWSLLGSEPMDPQIRRLPDYYWAKQPLITLGKKILGSFAKLFTHKYREKTTTSQIFMPCNLGPCRVYKTYFCTVDHWRIPQCLWTNTTPSIGIFLVSGQDMPKCLYNIGLQAQSAVDYLIPVWVSKLEKDWVKDSTYTRNE